MRWTLNALPSLMAGKKLLVWRLHASRAKLQALRLQVKSLQGTESDLQQQVRRLQTQHDHVRSIMAMEAETWRLRQMQKSALDLLQVYATETHQLKNKGLKAICRMMKMFLFSSLARWKERVTQDRHARRKTLKVVQRLMKATLVGAYVRWCNNTVNEKQMKTTALKVMQRLMNRTLVEGFERWWDQATEEKQMKAKALKVVHRLMDRALQEGFERWRDRVAGEKQMKTTALKMVFERWREHICEHKWRQKISEFCRSPILRDAFHAWLRLIQERHAKLRALHRLSQAWDLFLSSVGRARNMRKVAYSLHIRTTSRQLRCAFEVWVCCGFFISSYVAAV
jgi:hypothetical protein